MNPQSISEAEKFSDRVLLPIFTEIQECLTERGRSVLISSAATLNNPSALEILEQMGSDVLLQKSTNSQSWIGHLLYLETETIQDEANKAATLTERYCLTFQFTQTPEGQIGITPICAYSYLLADFSSIQIHRFSESSAQKDIQEVGESDITARFLESFRGFESYISDISELEPEPELQAQPEPDPIEPPQTPLDLDPEIPELSPLIPIQPPFNLPQRIQELTQQSSSPQFPTASKLNRNLPTTAQISPVKDRYDRISNLMLEYSPYITEADLVEHFSRLSHYQTFRNHTFQHGHLIPKIEAWVKKYGQPRPGAIAPHLQYTIAEHRKHLYSRLDTLIETHLDGVTAQSLHEELIGLKQTHQYQQTLLERLEESPLWGYLDASILADTEKFKRQYPQTLQSFKSADPELHRFLNALESNDEEKWNLFLTHYYLSVEGDSCALGVQFILHPITKNINAQLVLNQTEDCQYLLTESGLKLDVPARYLRNKDGQLLLRLIESEGSKKYKTYRQKHPNLAEQDVFVAYTVTQKLYSQRPTFIRNESNAVYPCIERWWCSTDAGVTPNPFAQIWCIHPMTRTDLPLWLVIAATTGTQPLKTITLENEQIAVEGTAAYLVRSLEIMMQCEDEKTQQLGNLLAEALGRGGVKYSHIHQEWNVMTNEPGDILQLQFQMSISPQEK
jgi:hypothetical protein